MSFVIYHNENNMLKEVYLFVELVFSAAVAIYFVIWCTERAFILYVHFVSHYTASIIIV